MEKDRPLDTEPCGAKRVEADTDSSTAGIILNFRYKIRATSNSNVFT